MRRGMSGWRMCAYRVADILTVFNTNGRSNAHADVPTDALSFSDSDPRPDVHTDCL